MRHLRHLYMCQVAQASTARHQLIHALAALPAMLPSLAQATHCAPSLWSQLLCCMLPLETRAC